jgi:hypothetical protein
MSGMVLVINVHPNVMCQFMQDVIDLPLEVIFGNRVRLIGSH